MSDRSSPIQYDRAGPILHEGGEDWKGGNGWKGWKASFLPFPPLLPCLRQYLGIDGSTLSTHAMMPPLRFSTCLNPTDLK